MLVDPSCSGSGLAAAREPSSASEFASIDEHDGQSGALAPDSAEVEALARAQERLVLHAMALPAVRVVVYSTCSVYRRENEDVVLRVLRACGGRFELAPCLPSWPHRGLDGADGDAELRRVAPLVCRAAADADSTNGFFVARFERVLPPAHAPVVSACAAGEAVARAARKAERKAARKAARKAERRATRKVGEKLAWAAPAAAAPVGERSSDAQRAHKKPKARGSSDTRT